MDGVGGRGISEDGGASYVYGVAAREEDVVPHILSDAVLGRAKRIGMLRRERVVSGSMLGSMGSWEITLKCIDEKDEDDFGEVVGLASGGDLDYRLFFYWS